MDAQTGLAVNAQALGIIAATTKNKKRARIPLQEGMLPLGPARSIYQLTEDISPAIKIVQHIIEQAGEIQLRWPLARASVEEIRDFAARLVGFSRAVRSFTTDGGHGFDGGRSDAYQYKVKSFVRTVLYMVEMGQPDIFDELKVADLLQWCPDQNEHCDVVASMSVKECRLSFTGSPLLLPCWLCILGWMDEDAKLRLCQVPDDELWEVMQDHDIEKSKDSDMFTNLFAIGLHLLLQHCSRGGE